MSKFIDLTGQKFGILTVINRAKSTNGGQSRWNCSCGCGNNKIILSDSLRSGKTKSCGCLQKEIVRLNNTIHGHKQKGKTSKTYTAWRSMLERCNNPNNKRYKDYKKRGITVCDRWNPKRGGSFKNFLEDMGECPPGLTLDRVDNNKLNEGYSPKNCRWATQREQQTNKRNNKLITYNDRTQCLSEWAKEYDIETRTLWARLYVLNWSIEKALLTPVKKYKRK